MNLKIVGTSMALVLLAGCGTTTTNVRRTWVDPATITDEAKYEQDFGQCRELALAVYREEQEARRAAIPAGAVVGAVVGAALGSAIAPSGSGGEMTRYGAAVGGLSGAGAAANGAGPKPTDVMLGAMRECLRGRGYRPIR